MSFFGFFGNKNNLEKIQEYLENSAVVIDVRRLEEWNVGHIEGSIHIVLYLIPLKIKEIKALNKSIIVVCKSGNRSGQAARLLSKEGIDVVNGGAWQDVARLMH